MVNWLVVDAYKRASEEEHQKIDFLYVVIELTKIFHVEQIPWDFKEIYSKAKEGKP